MFSDAGQHFLLVLLDCEDEETGEVCHKLDPN
jgi:hypothetical protein